MSSWGTNPSSAFFGPYWKLTCHNKWHPGTSEISTPLEIAVGPHFHASHGIKTIPLFLPADREASWLLLSSSASLLYGGTVQSENTYSCILKVIGQVWESQKRLSINTNHSYLSIHPPKSVSTDLTIKSNSVLTNPIGKDGVQG